MTDRPHTAHPPDDFDRLRGMLDSPIAPSPRFAQRLRAQVHEHANATATASAPTAPPEASFMSTPLTLPPTIEGKPPRPRPAIQALTPAARTSHRLRRWEPALAAAILVLVITGVVIGLSRLSLDEHDPSHRLAGSVLATPSATVTAHLSTVESTWGGDAGHSWAFDVPGFTSGQVRIEQGGEASGFANRQAAISNGSLIVTQHWKQADDDETFLEAFTVKGPSLWQVPIGAMPGMAIDDERLYVIRADRYTSTPSASRPLIAISLETGEVVWTGPDVGSSGKPTWSWSPIVANGTVYVADGKGSTWAVDAATGETRWESIVPDDAVPDRPDGSSATRTGGSIALGDGALWVAGWTNTIRKLNPATGKELATLTLDAGLRELDLALRGTSLAVRANTEDANGHVTSVLIAIDTDTDHVRWSQALPVRVDTNLVVLSDRVIVPRIDDGPVPMLDIDAYDLRTGERTDIPMRSLETASVSLAAIDGPKPLLVIVSQDGSLTVVDVDSGDTVGEHAAQSPSASTGHRPLPILIIGGETPIVAQPNGSWFRIVPD